MARKRSSSRRRSSRRSSRRASRRSTSRRASRRRSTVRSSLVVDQSRREHMDFKLPAWVPGSNAAKARAANMTYQAQKRCKNEWGSGTDCTSLVLKQFMYNERRKQYLVDAKKYNTTGVGDFVELERLDRELSKEYNEIEKELDKIRRYSKRTSVDF
jgi:hypothetical protein